FQSQTLRRMRPHSLECLRPMGYRLRIKVTRLVERLFAEELIYISGRMRPVEAIERRPEHHLGPPRDRLRQPSLRQLSQNVFILKAAQFPSRVNAGQEAKDVFIEERVTRLDGRMHGYVVAFGL